MRFFFHMIYTNMSWFSKSILCESILSSIWNVLVRIGTKSRSINMRLHYHDRNEIVNCASLFVCLFVFFWFIWKETFTLRTLYTTTLRATYRLYYTYIIYNSIKLLTIRFLLLFFFVQLHTLFTAY